MEYIYAVLLLHKLGQPITADSLSKVIASTGAQVDESKVKTLIASLNGVSIESELQNAQSFAAGHASAPAEAKKEEKKEEKQAESAAGLSALFG